MREERKTLPAVTLKAMTVLPAMIVHLEVNRDRSVKAFEAAMQDDRRVFLVTQKDENENEPGMEGVYRAGTIAIVKNIARLPHGGVTRVMVEGRERAWLENLDSTSDYLTAEVTCTYEEDTELTEIEKQGMTAALRDIFERYSQENGKIGKELTQQITAIEDLPSLMEQITLNLTTEYRQKQAILEGETLFARYEILTELMVNGLEILRIRNEIQRRVKERIDKNQKEYYLREQMKVIQEELGEDPTKTDADQYMERLQNLDAPEEVKEKLQKEIRRFKGLMMNSAESAVSRTYIETLLDMPWNHMSQDSEDLKKAEKILNEDHYGLEKVKERILEYLAVRILTKKGDSPILCLAGPPGTGKTSIARSVARALDKKYVRISLGGIRDEAEIRGHRRTYIGAMPGRIATGLKNAGVSNPLFLLDEIDKVSSSYNGDPSAALLEVLDSEQNCRFSDHYIELPLNLSEVMFICTANDVHTIPRPLLVRMEIIEISSYTENEKMHIAREHLLGKQKERHGLQDKQLTITNRALQKVIAQYTKEAGVRQLERKLGDICRKAARRILEGEEGELKVRVGNLEEYLGRPPYHEPERDKKDATGIVNGLAWTAVGGVTLQVEVSVIPGRGEFVLTGKLGDVMKESARTAISYVRSIAQRYDLKPEFFSEHDIHIHIPEGAVPKDGPSAGITMATAILSAVTDTPARSDVAMTGEITLRGRVLPIGGVKEKLLAARMAGMRCVIVPVDNRQEVEELSEEIIGAMKLVFASTMEDVLGQCLLPGKQKKEG